MEHRYSIRVATNINVLMYKADIPVAFGRILNGSKVGFFIETEFSAVNINQSLDIEFISLRSDENFFMCCCNVRVVRKTELGIGVEIDYTVFESMDSLVPYIQPFNYFLEIALKGNPGLAKR